MTKISNRGEQILHSSIRPDAEILGKAFGNIYDEKENKDGCLLLSIAENKLSAGSIRDYAQKLFKQEPIPEWTSYYTFPLGHPELLESFSKFYSRYISGVDLDTSNIACSAGVTAVIELSAMILADTGDCIAFPAPSYPAYTGDVKFKAGLERVDFELIDHQTHQRNSLSQQILNELLHNSKTQNKNLKMLVLTSPDNPTGTVYTREELELTADWCIAHNVHLMVNEIYALSGITTQAIYSFVNIMQDRNSPYLHLWYGMSKDFSSSGYRMGFLYSLNAALLKAYANMNGPHMVSGITQWLFTKILADDQFLNNYVSENKKRLQQSYRDITEILSDLGLSYLESASLLFIWVDFSQFLGLFSSEQELWSAIYEEANILLTPGEGFGHSAKGWFRLVYSCLTQNELAVFQKRLSPLIDRWNNSI